MDANEIRELFKKHDVPLGRKDIWDVKGKPVVHHAALERLAAGMGLTWDAPNVITAKSDEVVLWCRATRKDNISEWSFGEAKIAQKGVVGGNYRVTGEQPAYPFAMAEKRAKDRVIIKLAGLHGAYSNEEADEFADAQPKGNEPETKAQSTKAEPAKEKAKAEPAKENEAEANGAKVLDAELKADQDAKKAEGKKPDYTDAEKRDMLIASLRKRGTSIGNVAAWMAMKASQDRIKALPEAMQKEIHGEAKRLQANFQSAAEHDEVAMRSGDPRGDDGRMEDVPTAFH
jgi:hypothetical protein